MKIDRITGNVLLSDEVLGPALTSELCERSPIGFRREFVNNSWETYRGRIKDSDGEFAVAIFVKNNRISEMHLAKIQGVGSWASWSEESELQKQMEHNRILKATLGAPPYHFSWGEVFSVYDSKSGASEIIIRYAQNV